MEKKNKILKFILKILPSLIAITFGAVIFCVSFFVVQTNWQNLLISLASSLIVIPLIYICYTIWKGISQKRINKGIFDYCKNELCQPLANCDNFIKMISSAYEDLFYD